MQAVFPDFCEKHVWAWKIIPCKETREKLTTKRTLTLGNLPHCIPSDVRKNESGRIDVKARTVTMMYCISTSLWTALLLIVGPLSIYANHVYAHVCACLATCFCYFYFLGRLAVDDACKSPLLHATNI